MKRGFEDAEFQARTKRAQDMMSARGIEALLLTRETEIRYFTGYLTRFWESPSRPWFLVVPANGDPVAVIPSIGAELMGRSWISDIRTWSSPDLIDDGVSLLSETLNELTANDAKIATPSGHETWLRMPLADFERLKTSIGTRQIVGDDAMIATLRGIKSDAEIEKIEAACVIAGRAFDRVPEIASEGVAVDQVFRDFQRLCLEEGADWVPYLSGAAETDGYGDVISLAKEAPLQARDVLMLDTGLILDGYFCDYDRNFSVGAPSDAVASGHARLIEATDAGFEAAKPGAKASDIFHAMNEICSQSGGTDAGRLGHGLGMSLTEWPSLIATDHTEIKTGMVLTLEPGLAVGDKIMVHEENIVITESGARYLSPKANAEILRI